MGMSWGKCLRMFFGSLLAACCAGGNVWAQDGDLLATFSVIEKELDEGYDFSAARLGKMRRDLILAEALASKERPADLAEGKFTAQSKIFGIIGRLAIVEGQAGEAEQWYERAVVAAARPGGDPRRVVAMKFMQSSALAMDGRFAEARKLIAVANPCTGETSCNLASRKESCTGRHLAGGMRFGTWEGQLAFFGPAGPCGVGAYLRGAMFFKEQGRVALQEALLKAAVFASEDDRYATTNEAAMARLTSGFELIQFLTWHNRLDEARSVLDHLKADTEIVEYADPETARQLQGMSYLALAESNLAALNKPKSAPKPGAAPAVKVAEKPTDWDKEWSENESYVLSLFEDGPYLSARGAASAAQGFRRAAYIRTQQKRWAAALELNDRALKYAGDAVSKGAPVRVDFGPLPPECPPGRIHEPDCKEWYTEIISDYTNLFMSQLFADRVVIEVALGHDAEALKVDGFSQQILENWLKANWDGFQSVAATLNENEGSSDDRLRALATIFKRNDVLRAEAFDHAFKVGQLFQFNAVEGGLRDANVRNTLFDAATAQKWQRRRSLVEKRSATVSATAREALGVQIAEIDKTLDFSPADFERRAGFVPSDTQSLKAKIRNDEALVMIFSAGDRTEVMVLSPSGQSWITSAHDDAWFNGRVARVNSNLKTVDSLVFDSKAAYELYEALLKPLAAELSRKRLLLSTSGPLGELPLSLLVTCDPTKGSVSCVETYLIERHSLMSLVSVSALNIFRDRKTTFRSKGLKAFGAPVLKGAIADQLVPLNGARAEIEALEKLQFGGPNRVYVGPDATERNVKSADLQNVRVLEFATHALTKGELPNTNEPGLVLTTPASPTTTDDGYLTISEAAQLKIGADVVILSACNTSSSDGNGGEGLTGLAMSFLYAGGHSVIVSHWKVDDVSTQELILGTLNAGVGSESHQLADALALQMRALIQGKSKPAYKDPYYWAPFVLVD